jgi:hypothetical protein
MKNVVYLMYGLIVGHLKTRWEQECQEPKDIQYKIILGLNAQD